MSHPQLVFTAQRDDGWSVTVTLSADAPLFDVIDAIQSFLKAVGYDAGQVDGVFEDSP